jgi:hypothetical protein
MKFIKAASSFSQMAVQIFELIIKCAKLPNARVASYRCDKGNNLPANSKRRAASSPAVAPRAPRATLLSSAITD